MTPDEVNRLPLTQYLMLEVLAARFRLGETYWTFPSRALPAVKELNRHRLAWWRNAPTPHEIQVYLTQAGRKVVLSDTYEPPDALQPYRADDL